MNLFAALMTGFLAIASACTPSAVIDKGCEIKGGSGVEVHYKLGVDSVSFALRSKTPGYVGISFLPVNQTATFPADAVVGSALGRADIVPMQINMETTFISSGVILRNATATKSGDYTTLAFTRAFKDARFYLNPSAMRFRVASGPFVAVAYERSSTLVLADLVEGLPAADMPRPPPAIAPSPSPSPATTVPVAVAPPRTSSSGARDLAAGYAIAFAILSVLAST